MQMRRDFQRKWISESVFEKKIQCEIFFCADRATSVEAGSRGNSKRLVGAAKNSSWDEDERQTVANVINGYGNADKHPSKRHAGYLNPANDEDAEDDQEEEIDEEEDADDDAEEESADEGDHQQEEEEDEDQVLSQDKPTDNNVKRTSLALNKKRSLGQNKKHGLKKERPRSVDELLQRIGLEVSTKKAPPLLIFFWLKKKKKTF